MFLAVCALLHARLSSADEVARQARKADGPIVYYDMTAWHQLDLDDPVQLRRYSACDTIRARARSITS